MELTSIEVIKELLQLEKARPLKQLGQHFLIDRSVLKQIVEAAEITSRDIILEIGPGIGVLTQELAKRAKKVIAVEKDKKMVEILKETLKGFENVEVIQENILKYEVGSMKKLQGKNLQSSDFKLQTSYKMVANLPYYIVSPVIRKFLEEKARPREMVLMVQKEVAQRICAKPPDMNLLAVSVQFYSKPEIISYVSRTSFWPTPKVDSAIIRISQIGTNLPPINIDLFFKIVRAGFSQPRKQLANNLSKKLRLDKGKVKIWLLKNKIQPSQRAEILTLTNWKDLVINFNNRL